MSRSHPAIRSGLCGCPATSPATAGWAFCCVLPTAPILLPLLVWSSGPAVRVILALDLGAGLVVTYCGGLADRRGRDAPAFHDAALALERRPASDRSEDEARRRLLERAVRVRLQVFAATGARFGLGRPAGPALRGDGRLLRRGASDRMLAAVGRRGLRLLGPGRTASSCCPGGRVAFVFATESRRSARATFR